jgi:hypothetical protein
MTTLLRTETVSLSLMVFGDKTNPGKTAMESGGGQKKGAS